MKRILTLLLLLVISSQMFAQVPVKDRRPLWVGLDMGGTWQTSDMKSQGGIGWSFTLSRYSRLSKPGLLYWGWRFRFMDGRNFGYNYHPLTNIGTNPILSSGATNYATNAPAQNGAGNGFAYSNYKMHFDEFAFELIVGSNSLRKHGVLLYGFGGAGLNYWRTKTDQLGALGEMYDYTTINQTGGVLDVHDQLDLMWDKNYETDANGKGYQWSFMPSAGIGMGYQWGNGVAIGVEHRTTFALNDIIDGVSHDYAGNPTNPKNDQYHYDGFFIRWTFGGNSESHTNNTNNNTPDNPNNYTQNPTYTTPPNNNPPNNNPPNNNPPNNNPPNNQPTIYPPVVRFTTPSVDPYTTNVQNQQLVVRVDNINYSSQIQLLINNQASTNFSFNPNTNTMAFTHTLNPGTNVYQVTATNQAGSASDVQTIIYSNPNSNTPPVVVPPQVTITNPPTDPYTSAVQTMTVNATVLNVATAADIQIRRNTVAITNFTFNPSTHIVTFTANLQNGANLYEVIGTNTVGSASDAVTINYNPAPVIQPPVVTITSPATCPFTVKTATTTVTASITNMTAANQVTVVFNNQPVTNFSFTTTSTGANISFQANLVAGNNPFTVTGTNTAGTNSKSCVITYKTTTSPVPPVVTITNPSSCPYTAPNSVTTVTASITNVTLANQVSVLFNNQPITNFNFTTTSTGANISFQANLNAGSNPFSVTGTNPAGTNTKSCIINYTAVPVVQPPVVTITSPAPCPSVASNSVSAVTASITNVTAASQVTILLNNQAVTNFNFTTTATGANVSFSANLNPGSNPFSVTGTNAAGSNTKSCIINYTPVPVVLPPVVTITSPAACPYTAKTASTTVTASITNVTAVNQVSVVFNNQAVTNFSFTTTSTGANISFPANLNNGSNPFTVTGTNTAGTNSKSCTINYTAAPNIQPPVVTITSPAPCPSVASNSVSAVTASITNVTAASQVTILLNNQAVTNFNFTTTATGANVSFSANLNPGSNPFSVTGTNAAGSNTKSCIINYTPVPVVLPPVVTISNPSSCPFTVKTASTTVNASITNVTAASQVAVTFNNQPVTNFTFNATSGGANISFPANLVAGNNPFSVTGTNSAGTNSKSCVLIYKVSAPPVPPSVAITNPATSPYTATSQNMTLTATVLNVAGQNEITVKFNNATVTNFSYNTTSHVVSYNASLVAGSNNFTVTASNANGTDTKSATINWSVLVPAPTVTILTPASNPFTTTNTTENVTAQVMNVGYANQITVKDQNNQTVNFTFNANTHKIGFVANLSPGNNVYTITATNVSGTASDNITIKMSSPKQQSNPGSGKSSTSSGSGSSGRSSGSSTTTTPKTDSGSSTPKSGGSTTTPRGSGTPVTPGSTPKPRQ